MERSSANAFRWDGGGDGHYESYFQRANHPTEPRAFWIRYTVFVPRGRPRDAVGELWAIWFDGHARAITAVKQVIPYTQARFDRARLDARIGESTLSPTGLVGEATSLGDTLAWDLTYTSPSAPLLLFDRPLYDAPFPKAKALVGSPLARFDGALVVNGTRMPIDGWVGSQNHNWGSKHTDEYAWGQVAGFDGAEDSFLEVASARVKVGPVMTPRLTPLVLRHEGEEIRLGGLGTALRAHGEYRFFCWDFETRGEGVAIRGRIEADRGAFVGLPYDNPPGGRKTCLNSKLARCELVLERAGRPKVTLRTAHRAAFEILTDRTDHGVPVLGV